MNISPLLLCDAEPLSLLCFFSRTARMFPFCRTFFVYILCIPGINSRSQCIIWQMCVLSSSFFFAPSTGTWVILLMGIFFSLYSGSVCKINHSTIKQFHMRLEVLKLIFNLCGDTLYSSFFPGALRCLGFRFRIAFHLQGGSCSRCFGITKSYNVEQFPPCIPHNFAVICFAYDSVALQWKRETLKSNMAKVFRPKLN